MKAEPLAALRVLEFASLGPGPFAATLLADLGADVLTIDRAGGVGALEPTSFAEFCARLPTNEPPPFCRNRDTLAIDFY